MQNIFTRLRYMQFDLNYNEPFSNSFGLEYPLQYDLGTVSQ